jgi:hypothetical protein
VHHCMSIDTPIYVCHWSLYISVCTWMIQCRKVCIIHVLLNLLVHMMCTYEAEWFMGAESTTWRDEDKGTAYWHLRIHPSQSGLVHPHIRNAVSVRTASCTSHLGCHWWIQKLNLSGTVRSGVIVEQGKRGGQCVYFFKCLFLIIPLACY